MARAAGVSPATVSRALRGLDRVRKETRERVLVAAEELHYVASPTAASLASGKTQVVGVVVPFLTRWFFAHLIDGAEQELRRHGYHILLFNVGATAAARTLVIDQQLLWKRVDAVLVFSADLDAGEVALLNRLRLPIVGVGVDQSGWDRVGIDDVATSRRAAEHLLGLGHRRIGFVGGSPSQDVRVATAVDRLAGVRAALRDAGRPLDPGLSVESDWTIEGGVASARRLFAADDPPTAVLAASDEMAIGVLVEARRQGIDVPAQLSVMGIDDHEMAYTHDLTTIAQPVRAQGEAAGRLLLDALTATGPRLRSVVELPTKLVVRGTTAPPRRRPALRRLRAR